MWIMFTFCMDTFWDKSDSETLLIPEEVAQCPTTTKIKGWKCKRWCFCETRHAFHQTEVIMKYLLFSSCSKGVWSESVESTLSTHFLHSSQRSSESEIIQIKPQHDCGTDCNDNTSVSSNFGSNIWFRVDRGIIKKTWFHSLECINP